jgi:hypothetical protein
MEEKGVAMTFALQYKIRSSKNLNGEFEPSIHWQLVAARAHAMFKLPLEGL